MEWSESFESLREGNKLEVKAAQNGLPRSLWETYSAFANTDGGTILLGVEEDAQGNLSTCGVDNPEALVKSLWDGLNNRDCVSANLLTNNDVVIEVREGRQCIAITVPRAPRQDRPIYIRGNLSSGSFRRNGEGDYHCTPEELKMLMRESGNDLDRLVLEEFELHSLCNETISAYRNVFKLRREDHPWNQLSDLDFLMRLGAIGHSERTHGLHPTRAGLLMFGYDYEIIREYPNFFLDYRTRLGDRRWDDRVASMDGTWSGNVFDFWCKVCVKVTEGIPRPFALAPNMQRIDDTPMHKGLREALANALVHADYYGRRGCVILREPGRVIFANPGGLRMPSEVAIQGGQSDSRNTILMRMFNLAGIGERIGSGFDVMRAACAWADLPLPTLREEFNPDRTTLVFQTRPDDDTPTSGASPVPTSATYAAQTGSGRAVPHDMAVERILDIWESQGHGRSLYDPPVSATMMHKEAFDRANVRNASMSNPAEPEQFRIEVTQYRRKRRLLPREERELVMHFVIENGEIRRIEAQELLGIGSTKAKTLLNDMVKQGLLIVEGAGPSTRYLKASA